MSAAYVQLQWPLADSRAAAEAAAAVGALRLAGWSSAASNPGSALLVLGLSTALVGQRLHVVGEYSGVHGLSAGALDAAAACQRLTSAGFGRYVAIFTPPEPATLKLFRDPSGALEALLWRRGNVVVASNLTPRDLSLLSPPLLTFDWAQMARYAHDVLALGQGAGFLEITSVNPGVLWCEAQKRVLWEWCPPVPTRARTASVQDHAAQLRAAVRASTSSVAEQPLLVEISGGLDSAIVASAVRRHPGDRMWLNYYTRDPEGDERGFARGVAERLGVHLVEVEKPETRFDPDLMVCGPHGVRPSLNGLDRAYDGDVAARARTFGAAAIVTGQGGDAVFFRSRTPLIAADALLQPATARHWGGIVLDLARSNRSSVWRIGAEACASFLAPHRPGHFWVAGTRAPAKRLHLRNIVAAQAFYGECLRGRAAWLTHPLLLQPVIETVAGTPTPILVHRGVDRALARAAFADDLPSGTLARQGKGDLTGVYTRAVARDAPSLREFLLEGELRAHRIIEASVVDRLLDPQNLMTEGHAPTLLQWAATEAFVRGWRRSGLKVE